MACQELGSCLTQNANPQGGGLESARPSANGLASNNPTASGFCRAFDFTPSEGDFLVTIVEAFPLVTFGGDRMIPI